MLKTLCAALFALGLAVCGEDASQPTHSDAPQINSQKEPDRTLKTKEEAKQPEAHPGEITLSIPQHITITLNNNTSQKTDGSNEEGTEYWPVFWGFHLKITDSLLALFTLLLFVVTGGLVAIGYLQITTSRNQSRAEVHIATADMVNVAPLPAAQPGQVFQPTNATRTNPAIGPFAILKIQNFGQTTAYNVMHFAGICVREYPLLSELPAKVVDPNVSTKMAMPAHNGSQKVVQLPSPLTNSEITDLRNGNKAIYVYGDIEYRDGFGRKRVTNFQTFHNELGGRVGISSHLTGMEEGNDAT